MTPSRETLVALNERGSFYRGQIISEFIHIEFVLGNINSQVNHKGILEDYYTGKKTAGMIVSDFWTTNETIKHITEPIFINTEEIKLRLANILEERHRFSHYMNRATDEHIKYFDGQTIYLYSVKNKIPQEFAYDFSDVENIVQEMHEILHIFLQVEAIVSGTPNESRIL